MTDNKENLRIINERIINENISNLKNYNIETILNINVPSDYLKITDSLCGLNNIGNTCYINMGLQCLIHNKFFINNLIKEKINEKTPITRLFVELLNDIIAYKTINTNNILINNYSLYSYSPTRFKNIFSIIHPQFKLGQHDSI